MEKRMIGEYTVINSMLIGHKEIAIGENSSATKGERYMCCFIEEVAIFERYEGVLASDDYAEIARIFGERIATAAEEVLSEMARAAEAIGTNEELLQSDCTPVTWEDSIENKIVVIDGNTLRPEFRHASMQIMLCTGGFGAQASARGRTCNCISLYDGRQVSYYRSAILGVIDSTQLPDWAKRGLQKAQEKVNL